MPGKPDEMEDILMKDILASLYSVAEEKAEKRVRARLEQHLRIHPNADRDTVADVLISDEMEELDRLYEEHQDGSENLLAEVHRVLVEDRLPAPASRLKARG